MSLVRASGVSHPPVDPEVARARHLLLGLYVLLGITVSSWLARLPSVRDALGLSTGELGTVLLTGAAGSLATVLVAGGLVQRWGSRRVLLTAASMFSFATLLLGLGPTVGSTPLLVVGVVVMSSSFALGNVPMNVETAVIERRMRRTVVPQFHAAFSFGAIGGSVLGSLAAWGDVPVLMQFAAVSLGSLLWRVLAIPGAVLPATPAPVVEEPGPRRRGAGVRAALEAWRERRTLLIGVVVLAAALSEGSANNWLAIAVVDGFGRSEAVAAAVFGVFVGAMTVARVLGTGLIDRFGRVAVLRVSGTVSVVGLLLFGLAPTFPLAVLGVVGWGLGAGLAVPIGMVAVSEDPLRAAGRVAVVSAFASVASITAPPVIGLAAETIGARHALLGIGAVLVVGTLLSAQVRPTVAAPRREPDAVAPVLEAGGAVAVDDALAAPPVDVVDRVVARGLRPEPVR